MILALIEAVFQRATRGESCEDIAAVFVTWMEMLKSVAVVFHSSFLDFS
jgi:hypothetical protein